MLSFIECEIYYLKVIATEELLLLLEIRIAKHLAYNRYSLNNAFIIVLSFLEFTDSKLKTIYNAHGVVPPD